MMSEPETEGEPTDPAPGGDPDALYDDMIPQRKETMSQGMMDKLKKEAQQYGADPNVKQPPYILYVSAAIGVLVILGGKGILY